MSVRAYHLRRLAYRKTQGAVSNPGQPSRTNRKERRRQMLLTELGEGPCDCGNCLPGQDRECPATQILDPRD